MAMLDGNNLTNSTLEILSLLAVAFLLGYLLRLFMGNKWRTSYETMEGENFSLTNDLAASYSKIKSLEDSTNYLRTQVERSKSSSSSASTSLGISGSSSSSSMLDKGTKNPGIAAVAAGTASLAKAIPSLNPVNKPTSPGSNGTAKSSITSGSSLKSSSSQKKTSTKSTTKDKPSSKTSKSTSSSTKKRAPNGKKDNLTKVEGIGPKIQEIFNKAGIRSFDDLGENTPTKLRKILKDAGPRYKMHDPKTWPRQAKYASSGNWKKLKDYQDSLKGGRVG